MSEKSHETLTWELEPAQAVLLESLPQRLFVKDAESRYVWCNELYAGDLGRTAGEMVGMNDLEIYPKELADKYRADDRRVMTSGEPEELDERYVAQGGEERVAHTIKAPVRDREGRSIGMVGMFWDVTEERQSAARLEDLVRAQEQSIAELSTPVLQVWEGVLVAPLIGSLDSFRTDQFMRRLLEAVVETRSEVALVDITGVPTVDTNTAQHLVEAVAAVKLLGARVVLTGIRPAIAQTLVHLGVDLSGVETHASLATGLRAAIARASEDRDDSYAAPTARQRGR